MYVLEIIPIAKTFGIETLSYFSKENIEPGTFVTIPLRKKMVKGIVVESKSVIDMKGELKDLSHELKKVSDIHTEFKISSSIIETAKDSSNYFASNISSLLSLFLNNTISSHKDVTDLFYSKSRDNNSFFSLNTVQADYDERISHHKTLIREKFAQKKSLCIVVPTIEDGRFIKKELEKGIEDYIFFINGSISKNKLIQDIKKYRQTNHSCILITTPAFFTIMRDDTDAIVLERENGRGYKTLSRPFIDWRKIIYFFAKNTGMSLFMSDIMLQLETVHSFDESGLGSQIKTRILSEVESVLVDMKAYKTAKGDLPIFGEQADMILKKTLENKERCFVYCTRKGLSPSVICSDCQNIVSCNRCSAPVVLHQSKINSDKTFFLCHKCGERRVSEEYCRVCGSWKLGTVGIGIDLVKKKIEQLYPDLKLFVFENENKNEKKSIELFDKFNKTKGAVMLGTEVAVSYMHQKIENSIIVTMDSLLSLPDFRIDEKIIYLISQIKSLTKENLILQTRKINERIFEHALRGNIQAFKEEVLEQRKNLSFPPFSILIKITISGKKDEIVKDMEMIKELLNYEIEVFPAFTHTVKGESVLHGLIRVSKQDWPKQELVNVLSSFPPHIQVKIDPESLL